MRIELPSGAIGKARKFKTGDLQDLADGMEDDDLSAEGIFLLVRSSWIEVVDPGPYAEEIMRHGTGQPEWPRVLKGDLLGALLQTRVGSFRDRGDMYEFDIECAGDKCPPIEWEIDLNEAILSRAKPLPESSYEHLRTGEPLTTKLYDGTEVRFRLQTTANEAPVDELRRQQLKQKRRKSPKPNMIDQLASQIISVQGKNLSNIRQIWQWVHALELQDALDLQQAFEAADCGYETEIEVRCNQCRRVQQVDLPLQTTLLVPRRRPKKSSPDDGEAEAPSS